MAKTFSQRMQDGITALDNVQSPFDYASTYTVSFVDAVGQIVEAIKREGFAQVLGGGALCSDYAELVFSTPDGGRMDITLSMNMT